MVARDEIGSEPRVDLAKRCNGRAEVFHGALLGIEVAVGEIVEEVPDRYLKSVRRTLDYIREGDVFQANLSRSWYTELSRPAPSHAIYRRLRELELLQRGGQTSITAISASYRSAALSKISSNCPDL